MAIEDLIARPPAFDARTLMDPLQGYEQGVDVYRGRQMRNALSQGLPRGADGQVDWARAVEQIADAQARYGRDPSQAASTILQAQQVRQEADFAQQLAALAGGGTPAARPAAQPARPPVGFAPPATPVGFAPQAPLQGPNAVVADSFSMLPTAPPANDPTMTVSPRQVAIANGGNAPALLPPAQTGPIPGVPVSQPGATPTAQPAATNAATATVDPAAQQRIASLWALMARARTPQQAQALAGLINQLNPEMQIIPQPDGTIVAVNKRTQQAQVIHQGARPQWGVVEELPDGSKRYGFIDPARSSVNVPPGLTTPPSNPYSQGRMTEGQSNAALYATRMFEAERILRNPAIIDAATSSMQNIGLSVGNRLPFGIGRDQIQGSDIQRFDQARRDFINAVLRRESGAVISEAEFENARRQYFPQPGDTLQVIQQKQRNREDAIRGIAGAAGPNYRPPYSLESGSPTQTPRPQQPQPQQPSQPVRVRSVEEARALRSGTRFIDPNGIERVVP